MTDREVIEECYRLVAALCDGKRERAIRRLLAYHLSETRCAELKAEARSLR